MCDGSRKARDTHKSVGTQRKSDRCFSKVVTAKLEGPKAQTKGTQEMVAVWEANASGRAIHCFCDLLLRLSATSDDIKASVRLAEEGNTEVHRK